MANNSEADAPIPPCSCRFMAADSRQPSEKGAEMWQSLHMNADMRIQSEERAEAAAGIFAMLADPTRVRIILALQEAELAVGPLAAMVDKNPAAVSQHLAKLRLARMVSARQDGTRVFYRLTDEHAGHLVAEAFFQAEHTRGGVPAHHLGDGL